MPKKNIYILSVKWGTKYPADYVNRLLAMTRRNLSYPHQFCCLTDDASGLHPDIRVLSLKNQKLEGWWNKLQLFKADFFGLSGTAIYMDLDVVITGSLDFIIEQPAPFCIIRNWSRNKMWNSSVMKFELGQYSDIWESFCKDQRHVIENYAGDQEWIFQCLPNAAVFPAEKIVSYKKSCNAKAFRRLSKLGLEKLGLRAPRFMKTQLPSDARIVVFHGKPDPEDVMNGPYGLWKHAPFIRESWK